MENYFKRQIQLWGSETQHNLRQKKVLIVGAGGLGSSSALALGSVGIGQIDIVDFDKVEIHNIHRQIAFKLNDEGKYKAKVTKKLIEKKSTFTAVTVHTKTFEDFTTYHLPPTAYHLIIDATDNLQTRQNINDFAKENNIPWIYGSVEEFNGHVCFFDKANFTDTFKITQNTPKGIATPMVMQVASLQANLALRFLCGLSVKKDSLYYLYYNNEGEFETKKFELLSQYEKLQSRVEDIKNKNFKTLSREEVFNDI
jgi:molybdopterin/thiamine biosynthesis adenylyltransferase